MALILRVDVDKPYGRSTLTDKILSKVREDYWFPAIYALGYLNHLKIFLEFLSEKEIKSHIYFRKCTLPHKRWAGESLLEGHMLGLHAEDTRSYESLKKELKGVQSCFAPKKINSFTKHGSGYLKLGRYHYPPYEPDKYLRWAETLGIPFLFGNEENIYESQNTESIYQYYPGMFWIERYRNEDSDQLTLPEVVRISINKNVVVIIHPEHFIDNKQVKTDMMELVLKARQQKVPWITIGGQDRLSS